MSKQKPAAELILHSDRGSPFTSDDDRTMLTSHGLIASVSRKSNGWGNAVAESFFGTLKGELVDLEIYATRKEANESLGDSIENFSNVQRRHSAIGNIHPMEFEWRLQSQAEAASCDCPRKRGRITLTL